MNTEINLSELFDRYLENDLNILERQEFELHIRNDREFAERFRLHKEVDRALIEDDILRFRQQLEIIGLNNSELVQAAPMVIAEEVIPEIDQAILELDIMALRAQLNRIHSSVLEEVDPVEIGGYAGIEEAILNQDSVALNKELNAFEELVMAEGINQDLEMTLFMQDVDKAIMQKDVMSLRNKLEEIGERSIVTPKSVPIQRRVITIASSAVAAVFLLLLAGTLFLSSASGSLTSDKVLSSYFQAYDVSVPRGPSGSQPQLKDIAIEKYATGQHSLALELFRALDKDSTSPYIDMLAGNSAMLIGAPDLALQYFARINSEEPAFEYAEWYAAGCYLKKGDLEKAKGIITKISEDSTAPFNNQAKELLKKFEKE